MASLCSLAGWRVVLGGGDSRWEESAGQATPVARGCPGVGGAVSSRPSPM